MLMEPVALFVPLAKDKDTRVPRVVGIGNRCRLEVIGDDVVVFMDAEPSILEFRIFRREYRIGSITGRIASKVRNKLDAGQKYRAWVSDLPFPTHAPNLGIKVSVWMETTEEYMPRDPPMIILPKIDPDNPE